MTDIARDNRRADAMNVWLDAIAGWLDGRRGAKWRRTVDQCADAVEAIPRGYWSSSRGFRAHSDRVMAGLEANDLDAWRKFLAATDEAPEKVREVLLRRAPAPLRQGQRR